LSQAIIVTIVDHADFSNELKRAVFENYQDAHKWGTAERDAAREKLKVKGEEDEDFIEAIVYEWRDIDYFAKGERFS
jgi:hypothetical protein